MAKLIIKRSSDWYGILRNYRIYLDGVKLDVIRNGETKEFDVKQGSHSLYSRLDWCGSPTLNIEIKEGETRRIELTNNKSNNWLSLIAAIAGIAYLTFGNAYDLNPLPFLVLILPGIFSVVYFATFGRNRCFKMKMG